MRSGGRAGDDIHVSGSVGDARLALEVFRGRQSLPGDVFEAARARLEQPTPRVALGQALRGIATSAIDISDGLAGDLGHILRQSGVGARIECVAALGLLASTAQGASAAALLGEETRLELVLGGGDDYELLFTAPASARDAVQAAAIASATPVTRIGMLQSELGLRLVDAGGALLQRPFESFDHFA